MGNVILRIPIKVSFFNSLTNTNVLRTPINICHIYIKIWMKGLTIPFLQQARYQQTSRAGKQTQ